jgi:hypothetical protein
MIMDKELVFSDNQRITSTTSSTAIDLKAPGDAVGQELNIRVIVTEAFAGLSTLQINIQTADTTAGLATVLSTAAIPLAQLTRGAELLCIRVPKGLRRYIRLTYTVGGTASAGAVTAFMSKEL